METLKQISRRIGHARARLNDVRDLSGTHGHHRRPADWSEAESLELAAQYARQTAVLCIQLERALLERRDELAVRQEAAQHRREEVA
jgi:hypothetical protein